MKVTARQLAEILVEKTSAATKRQLPRILKEYVELLAEHGLLAKWREIEREVNVVWKKKFGAATITVVSAHALTAASRKTIEGIAPGAEIRERVDDRLIGGAVIRLDDTRIDGSVAGTLRRLKATLVD